MAMNDSPAVVVVDKDSNVVGVIVDGLIYRLQVEAKLVAAGSPVTIGVVDQGLPNTGGALSWPVIDAVVATILLAIKDTDGIKKIVDPVTVLQGTVPWITDGSAFPQPTVPQTVGAHGNAWSAAAVGAGGTSTSLDTRYTPFVSIFGNTSGGTVLTVQLSQNDADWYDSTTHAVNGDFGFHLTIGARYVRLKNSVARTITATIAAKD
jgi:hypothetical protein